MIFFGENADGSFRLDCVSSVVINSEISVPADDMTVKVEADSLPSLWKIYAAKDGAYTLGDAIKSGGILFEGIVDEQVTTRGISGGFVTVYARSPAALALDSECETGRYVNPSAEVMYKRHLARFGIKNGGGEKKCAVGEMNVAKGQSHYGAVRKFCAVFLGTIPRISSVGVFRSDVYSGDTIVFGSGGIGFEDITVRERRCVRVSRITASLQSGETTVVNPAAISDGIKSERRISLLDSSTGTLSDADRIIKNGEDKRLTVSLDCLGYLGDIVGRSAKLDYTGFEQLSFAVAKTKYTSGENGERTRVVLALRQKE